MKTSLPKSVTFIDPLDEGHHLDYAVKLARGLQTLGVDVYAVGSSKFIESLANHGLLREGRILDYRHQRGWRAAYTKRTFLSQGLQLAEQFKTDIVHLLYLDHFILPLLQSRPAVQRLNLRATVHHAHFLKAFNAGITKQLQASLSILAFKQLVKQGMRVMMHSKSLIDLTQQQVGVRSLDYVPYPIDQPEPGAFADAERRSRLRAQYGIPPESKLLLAFGGTRFKKGADLAVQVLAQLPPEVHLLVAGQQEDFSAEALQEVATRFAVGPRLHLNIDWIPDGQVLDYFSVADVILIPYRKTFAGQSGPLTIAGSLGIPVVSADNIVLKETVLSYGLGHIFESENISAMAEAIKRIDTHPSTSHRAAFCNDHDLPAFAKAVYQSYLTHL